MRDRVISGMTSLLALSVMTQNLALAGSMLNSEKTYLIPVKNTKKAKKISKSPGKTGGAAVCTPQGKNSRPVCKVK